MVVLGLLAVSYERWCASPGDLGLTDADMDLIYSKYALSGSGFRIHVEFRVSGFVLGAYFGVWSTDADMDLLNSKYAPHPKPETRNSSHETSGGRITCSKHQTPTQPYNIAHKLSTGLIYSKHAPNTNPENRKPKHQTRKPKHETAQRRIQLLCLQGAEGGQRLPRDTGVPRS